MPAPDAPRPHMPKETPPEDELKLVTLLFADMKGFTALSETLEPDEVKEILDELFGRLTRILEAETGCVIKYEGDLIMAAFGLGTSRAGDPVHACYAALAMREEVARYATELSRRRPNAISMRIGVNTGRVVVGRIGGRLDVLGDAVNLAARMEQNAPTGGILVAGETVRLAAPYFEFEAIPPFSVKGKAEPVAAAILVGKAAPGSRRVLGRATAFVSRAEPLARLTVAFDRCVAGKTPAAILVEGPPGVGKSRLLLEFLRRLDAAPSPVRPTVCLNRFNPGRTGTFNVLRVFLAGRGALDSAAALETFLATTPAGRKRAERRSHAALLDRALSLGLGLAADPALDPYRSPEQLGQAVLALGAGLMERAARSAPVALLVEDLQWADEGSVRLLSHLAHLARGPVLLAATTRPGWRGDARLAALFPEERTVRIDPLPEAESRRMLAGLLGVKDDEALAPLARRVHAAAAGNPLFIEELAITLGEGGVARGGRIDPERLPDLALPSSLRLVIQERLESLPHAQIEYLRAASVIGRRFYTAGVEALLPPGEAPFDPTLALGKGLLVPAAGTDPSRAAAFEFAHETTRDAIYDTLTRRRKRRLHALFAARLAAAPAEALAALAEPMLEPLLARHHDLADEGPQALVHALAAGRALDALYQIGPALRHFDIADRRLAGDPACRLEPAEHVRYLEAHCRLLDMAVGAKAVLALLARHAPFVARAGRLDRLRVELPRLQAATLLGNADEGGAILSRVRRLAAGVAALDRSREAAFVLAKHWMCRGERDHATARFASAAACHRKARAILERLDHPWETGECLARLSHVLQHLYRLDEQEEVHAAFEALARRTGNPFFAGQSLMLRGNALYVANAAHPEALACYDEAIRRFERFGALNQVAHCHSQRGVIHHNNGRLAEAHAEYERALAIHRALGNLRNEAFTSLNLGNLAVAAGREDDARPRFEACVRIYRQVGDLHGETFARVSLAAIDPDPASAMASFRRCLKIFTRLHEHFGIGMCLTRLGDRDYKAGRIRAAARRLHRAAEHFRKVGQAAYLDWLRSEYPSVGW